jgi:hypothetical protein
MVLQNARIAIRNRRVNSGIDLQLPRRITTHCTRPAPSALCCIGSFAFAAGLIVEWVSHGAARAGEFDAVSCLVVVLTWLINL